MDFISRLHTKTLDAHPQHLAVKKILSAALEAADPAKSVQKVLFQKDGFLQIKGQSFQLERIDNIYLVAFGKAAPAMAFATSEILGDSLSDGIVVSKYATDHDLGNLSFHIAGHPAPNEKSLIAGKAILELLSQSGKNDLILFLISGGGSALIIDPIENISLHDLQELTSLLLGNGVPVDKLNTLRRALSRIKGGGLAKAAHPAKIASLILSDVVNSPLEAIASGPTLPNPTTNADALAILKKYNLLNKVSANIITALEKAEQDKRNFPESQNLIVGSIRISAKAARDKAIQEGFKTQILTTSLQGEAAEKGKELARHLLATNERPLCLIVGGETTVSLGDSPGHGGRNQEVALAAVKILAGQKNIMLITLATDGDDGPTDAAGAVVTGETLERAKILGLDLDIHLHEHNAYPFFDALGDLLKPGPTGTNVNDLVFLFAY